MIAKGLQRLDAQDCKRWQLGCKNWLTSACGNICWAPEIETHSWNEIMVMHIISVRQKKANGFVVK